MKNNVVLISDAHIKNRLWTNNSLVTGDAYEALKIISSNLPRDDTTNYLISCGDFFDTTRPTSKDLTEAGNFFNNFHRVYYVDGNHDKVDPSLMAIWSERCVKLTTTPVTIDNLRIFGVDYCSTKEELFEQLSEISRCVSGYSGSVIPVIILHQALKEFLSFDGSYICSCEDLFSMFNTEINVYCGDIHISQMYSSDESFVLSPGPLVPQDIGQATKDQYWYTLDTFTGKCKKAALKVRDITITKTLSEFTKAISKKPCDNLPCKSLIYALLPVGVELPKLDESLKQDRIIIVRRISEKASNNSVVHRSSNSVSLKDAIIQDIEDTQKKPDKLVKLASVLIDSSEPDTVLQTLLTKMGVLNAST